MPNAEDVKPGRWSSIKVLFDNDWYSIIAGTYDGEESLGERWNGDGGDIGFPNTRGYAQWHVVPDFLNVPILQGALEEIRRNPYNGSDEHKKQIVAHLSGYYMEY
jgi:hypothetical protein